jgi:hypothetical protein
VDIELKELKSGHTRLEDEARTAVAQVESARDRELELSAELDAAKRHITELEKSQATAAADDREKKKAEMLAEMIAKIDVVRSVFRNCWGFSFPRADCVRYRTPGNHGLHLQASYVVSWRSWTGHLLPISIIREERRSFDSI